MKISNPVTPPPLFFFLKIQTVFLLDNFSSMLGSAIQFYKKFRFGGYYRLFKFLGYLKKKLKPKICDEGG